MLEKIFGGLLLVVGFFIFALGPFDRIQIEAFSRSARLVGLALMVVGVILIKM
jgi:uncharacterized protein YjeT (DUF2065 family)